MLTAHKLPRACHSCRLQLLSLFEHGFTKPVIAPLDRSRYSTSLRPSRRTFESNGSLRRLSTTTRRAQDVAQDMQRPTQQTAADIESVVRQARQTFGETLPKNFLTTEEYVLYERLYGPPLRETKADDLMYLPGSAEDVEPENVRNVLLKENSDGEFEEIEYDPELGFSIVEESAETIDAGEEEPIPEIDHGLSELTMEMEDHDMAVEDGKEVEVQAKNQREIDVIIRLQRDMDAAAAQPIEEDEEFDEEFEEEEEEDDEELDEDETDGYIGSDEARTHPHTMTGRSGTIPSTLFLPQEQFVEPITELLGRTNKKHLAEAAERAFGGKGLPHSTSTAPPKKLLPQKHIGLDAAQHKMSDIEADAYLAGVMPGTYASVMSVLVEVRKRLGSEWLRELIFRDGGEGPRILDAGSGGAGTVAWREILKAEWEVLKEEGRVKGDRAPWGKSTVLTGPSTLRHRVSRFLDNTTFLPRLPDYIHAANSEELLFGAPAQGRKAYDIIIASHTLFPLKEDFRRKNMVQNLWSLLDPDGGVLILVEKGLPRGFEAIAGARDLLLDSRIASPGQTSIENEIQSPSSDSSRFYEKEQGMIIAPCTNHKACPMYPIPGLTTGRKDYCHFGQRYIRPPFLQNVLGAKGRNHEDVKFSYVAVRRGVDSRNHELHGNSATDQAFEGYEDHDLPGNGPEYVAEPGGIKFNVFSLPRAILPPLKRRGHVTLDLCTPSGTLERWTVPKSFSRAAYRDARKSQWGDLWALGSKTRTLRSPRLGRKTEDGGPAVKVKGIRDGKMGKGGKKMKKNMFNIVMGKDGYEGVEMDRSQAKFLRPQKRTKGGRVYKPEKPITEDDF
ncbi:putative S-adenosyl-L-methionine-dependent RNA methyltransferase [Hyphodiscus hymeniophilus]|uniref:S-adenosyl-L-methionine-dependent RNA methyltransferase n=1 Tax=Hyphodiscus hymeniophilus TaxID=353542 RepID=A0A9P7AYQ1_9HELO|nr:putative S-adenosyl-L-methionine-dependent RNA methyltransferase [Hyphodiscus hymeniophilus]